MLHYHPGIIYSEINYYHHRHRRRRHHHHHHHHHLHGVYMYAN